MASFTFETLQLVFKENITEQETNRLLVLSQKIALTILSQRNGLSFADSNPTALSDLAVDSVTPLFIKDKSGVLPIKTALLNWDKKIIDDSSSNYFLYKIINNRVDQEISKKLKDADPFFAKIFRSFNHLVNTERINKTAWFGVCYLVPKNIKELTQKPITPDELEKFPSFCFQGSSEKIIERLFKYLKDEKCEPIAVPLNALIRKIKHVNGSFLEQSNPEHSNDFFEDKIDIPFLVKESLKSVHEKIDTLYFNKGKFNLEETDAVKKVIKEFSLDLQDGGISRGMFDYVSPYLPNLSKESFYDRFHKPLDYLLKLLKSEIAHRLELNKN